MPSKHMLPKGKRRHSVRAEYRAAREAANEAAAADAAAAKAGAELKRVSEARAELPEKAVARPVAKAAPDLKPDPNPAPVRAAGPVTQSVELAGETRTLVASETAAGMRLDAFLAQAIPDISRARAQLLIEAGQVRVDGTAVKASYKLRASETVRVEGEPRPEPLHAIPEDIPLDILYEDEYLAIINKRAGMMVHAGAGASEDARSRGTLVNALLHHMGHLSQGGDPLRPGIVHRLDKETSGAIVVAKDDVTHRKLSEMFSGRLIEKTYVALVHGRLAKDDVSVDLPVARDPVRRTRMTTRRADGRQALSHVHVVERLSTPRGPFTLVEVRIETGRTHQIRVHMQSLGHPVVGDVMYGAPRGVLRQDSKVRLKGDVQRKGDAQGGGGAVGAEEHAEELGRNFLHAAHLEFEHPRTGRRVAVDAPLPEELQRFLSWLRS